MALESSTQDLNFKVSRATDLLYYIRFLQLSRSGLLSLMNREVVRRTRAQKGVRPGVDRQTGFEETV